MRIGEWRPPVSTLVLAARQSLALLRSASIGYSLTFAEGRAFSRAVFPRLEQVVTAATRRLRDDRGGGEGGGPPHIGDQGLLVRICGEQG